MAMPEIEATRYPKAAIAGMGITDYSRLFGEYRQQIGEIDLSYLALGMAAGELAIAITQSVPDTEPATSLHSRLPDGEMDPEKIFDFLTDAERQNLPRATLIVDLMRASFTVRRNTESRGHSG